MALTRRDVRVTVTHDGKPMLTLPAAAALRDRLAAVYGGRVRRTSARRRRRERHDARRRTRRAARRRRHRDTPHLPLGQSARRARHGHRARGGSGVSLDDSGGRPTDAVPRHRRRRRHGRRQRASGQGRSALSRSLAGRAHRGDRGPPRARHVRRGATFGRPAWVVPPRSLRRAPRRHVDVEALASRSRSDRRRPVRARRQRRHGRAGDRRARGARTASRRRAAARRSCAARI